MNFICALACFGCTTLGCYKDSDEIVYYNNANRKGDVTASNINKSDGRGSNEDF